MPSQIITLLVVAGTLFVYIVAKGKRSTQDVVPVESISYEEIIEHFANTETPNTFEKAAVIRKNLHGGEILISLVFLDSENEIINSEESKVFTKTFRAKSIDQELNNVFDGKNIIDLLRKSAFKISINKTSN